MFRIAASAASTGLALLIALPLLSHCNSTKPIYLEEPGWEDTGHRYLYDEDLGWRNIPGWRDGTTRGAKLHINSKGLRDREYPYKKPAGTKRILVLGDSYAWGYGVANEEAFGHLLEQNLKKTNGVHKWEVLNGGVSGYGTDQAYLWLQAEGLRYEPDIVVLAFFLVNDPENNESSVQYGLQKPVFLNTALELANVPVPTPFQEAPVIKAKVGRLELTMAILQAMDKECQNAGAQFVVMKFGRFLYPDHPKMIKFDKNFATKLGGVFQGPFLDLDAAFKSEGFSPFVLLNGNNDGHWNEFGHEQTAILLERFLREQGSIQ